MVGQLLQSEVPEESDVPVVQLDMAVDRSTRLTGRSEEAPRARTRGRRGRSEGGVGKGVGCCVEQSMLLSILHIVEAGEEEGVERAGEFKKGWIDFQEEKEPTQKTLRVCEREERRCRGGRGGREIWKTELVEC